jgi:hypothetical protein
VTFVEQSAAARQEDSTPPRRGFTLSRRAWVGLVAVVLALAAVGGYLGWRQVHQPATGASASGYSQVTLDGLASWTPPHGFSEVSGAFGCQVDDASRCFVTDRAGTGLARSLAQQLRSPRITWKIAGPFSVWGDSYWMCAAVGPATVALIGVQPHVVNAIKTSDGVWSVLPGVKAHLHGSVMSVSLYSSSQCTNQDG